MVKEDLILKVQNLSKKDREVLSELFKEISVNSIIKKGLKETYKSAVRNHVKFAILVNPSNLSDSNLLNPFLIKLIENKVPFFYVNSLKEISRLLNKDFNCTCTGLLQISKKFETKLKELSDLIYNV